MFLTKQPECGPIEQRMRDEVAAVRRRLGTAKPKLHLVAPLTTRKPTPRTKVLKWEPRAHMASWYLHRFLQLREEGEAFTTRAMVKADFLAIAPFDWADVCSPRREGPLVRFRQALMESMKRNTASSLPAIGNYLHKDHTTVLHAIRRVEAACEAGQVETLIGPSGIDFHVRLK